MGDYRDKALLFQEVLLVAMMNVNDLSGSPIVVPGLSL